MQSPNLIFHKFVTTPACQVYRPPASSTSQRIRTVPCGLSIAAAACFDSIPPHRPYRSGLACRASEESIEHLLRGDRIAVPRQRLACARQEITSLSTSTPSQSKMTRSTFEFKRCTSSPALQDLYAIRISLRRAGRNTAPAGDRPVCSRACGRSRPAISRSPRR